MSDMIQRKLNAMKQELSQIENKINKPEPVQKTTTNLVPAGVPEVTEPKKEAEPSVPGVITGGPRMSKKMKEV
jgi:hypothetical protein|tara:strand:+ start:9645 stop:9863 length:219 start_codon:yes stop_codon:yes gene_type:complete